MKLLKRLTVITLILICIFSTCPQGVLINLNSKFSESSLIVDKKIIENNKYLTIDVTIPQIDGLSDKEVEKVINKKILNFTSVWISDVKEIANEYYGDINNIEPRFPYQLISKYIIKRQNKILSFYIDYYQFTGGAHGITNRVNYNIDINTGKEMLLKDLFSDEYEYEKIINNEIEKQIAQNPDNYFIGKDGFNGINEKQKYFMDEENIILFFNEYEIAPYAAGIPEFKIPIKLFGESFKYGNI
ncbi:MAG: DUF3298 and DUF4163 domain-containing protein [Terrisporobacter sp.]